MIVANGGCDCSGNLEQKERMKAREERENNKTRESSNFGLDLR